jgi:hypothetical protein
MAIATPEQPPAARPSERGLPLPSLRIRGYRLFEDLTLPRLARVNLITGRNNAGKTALLEAIHIWADGGSPQTLLNVIQFRGGGQIDYDGSEIRPTWSNIGIMSLFPGHPASPAYVRDLEIGPNDQVQCQLRVSGGRFTLEKDASTDTGTFIPNSLNSENQLPTSAFGLSIRRGEKEWLIPRADLFSEAAHVGTSLSEWALSEPCISVDARGLSIWELERLWDAISLTDDEDEVIGVVQLLAPTVRRLSFRSTENHQGPVPYVRVSGVVQPIPLARLGDGAIRALGIGLALVNSQNGCLLLDEVENGIHYSVQPNLWRMIFTTAKRLNVQVFATTHSYDCIRGFQQAASENEEVEGQLIRLLEHEGQIVPTTFDERDLEIATRRNLEAR